MTQPRSIRAETRTRRWEPSQQPCHTREKPQLQKCTEPKNIRGEIFKRKVVQRMDPHCTAAPQGRRILGWGAGRAHHGWLGREHAEAPTAVHTAPRAPFPHQQPTCGLNTSLSARGAPGQACGEGERLHCISGRPPALAPEGLQDRNLRTTCLEVARVFPSEPCHVHVPLWGPTAITVHLLLTRSSPGRRGA